VRHDLEIHTRHRPIQILDARKALRILDSEDFDVVWTDNGWQTKQATACRALGCARYCADITPPAGSSWVEWTLHWPQRDAWLGFNVRGKTKRPDQRRPRRGPGHRYGYHFVGGYGGSFTLRLLHEERGTSVWRMAPRTRALLREPLSRRSAWGEKCQAFSFCKTGWCA
jgi:hypothetical protein